MLTDGRRTDGRRIPLYTISSPLSLRLRWDKNQTSFALMIPHRDIGVTFAQDVTLLLSGEWRQWHHVTSIVYTASLSTLASLFCITASPRLYIRLITVHNHMSTMTSLQYTKSHCSTASPRHNGVTHDVESLHRIIWANWRHFSSRSHIASQNHLGTIAWHTTFNHCKESYEQNDVTSVREFTLFHSIA